MNPTVGPTIQKNYVTREHRFSISDLENLDAFITRTTDKGISAEMPADLLDFSRKGLKLKVPACLRFEEAVRVRLIYDGSQIWYDGVATIRHIRAEGDHSWIVGCSIEPLVREEIIEQLAAVSGKERRLHSRFPVCGEGTIQIEGQTQKSLASLKNLSESGFCLIVPSVHQIGDRIKFEIEDHEFVLHSIDACVRWQLKTDEGYRTGCSFADTVGFERLIRCVKDANEKKPEKMSRFVLLIAGITMLFPPVVSLLLQSNVAATQDSIQRIIANVDSVTNQSIERQSSTAFAQDTRGPDEMELPIGQLVPDYPPVNTGSSQPDLSQLTPVQADDPNSETAPEPDQDIPVEADPEPTADSPLREWVDNSGQHRIEARLESLGTECVQLRTLDGRLKKVPMDRLSQQDLLYLLRLASDSDH